MVFSIVCYVVVSVAVLAFVGSGRCSGATAIAPSSADLAAAYALAGVDAVCPDLTVDPDALTAEELAEEGCVEVLEEPAPVPVVEPIDFDSMVEFVREFPARPVTPRFEGLHIFTLRALGALEGVKGASKWKKGVALAHFGVVAA